jgi:hypothetical protein
MTVLRVRLKDAQTGRPAGDTQPWLGAAGHLMIIHEDGQTVVHSHPKEDAQTHALVKKGEVLFTARFPKPGIYRAFAQFQRAGEIKTLGFTLPVKAPTKAVAIVPTGSAGLAKAVVKVDNGYAPATVNAKVDQRIEITFVRSHRDGCGETVKFPSLGISKKVEHGGKVTVALTPKKAGTIPFTCGMDMYKGKVAVR